MGARESPAASVRCVDVIVSPGTVDVEGVIPLMAAFVGFELPLWFVILFLGVMFAPAVLGGAALGVVVGRGRGRGAGLAGAIAGSLSACVLAALAARLLFGGYRGTVDSDDLFWSSIAVGVLCSVVAVALLVVRRLRPAPPSSSEQSAPTGRIGGRR